MRAPTTAAVCAVLLLSTACGGAEDDPFGDAPIDQAPDDEVPVEDPDDGSTGAPDDEFAEDDMTDPDGDPADSSDPLLGPEVETALDETADRSGVAREELSVTVTELVTWPDGAAGCPEPDMMYTQALVDGFRIVIEADGEQYHYVGANGEQPSYCEDPQDPVG
jgi:hypothetical protein